MHAMNLCVFYLDDRQSCLHRLCVRTALVLVPYLKRIESWTSLLRFLLRYFLSLSPRLRADVVFLSPPWGGVDYTAASTFDVRTMMGGLDGAEILRCALLAAPNACYFLPKNVDLKQVARLAREEAQPLELERCHLNGHVKGLLAYYGFVEEDEVEVAAAAPAG